MAGTIIHTAPFHHRTISLSHHTMFRTKSLVVSLFLALMFCTLTGYVYAQTHTTHKVAAGETLTAIAARYGVSIEALSAANDITNSSLIYVGQELIIPSAEAETEAGDEAEMQAPPEKPAKPLPTSYTARAGDTLSTIARQQGVSLAALAAANKITQAGALQAGQRLVIPPVAALDPPATVGRLKLLVSISRQQCQVLQDGKVLYDWVCSTGRVGSGTQAGVYFVQSKYRNAWGSRWGFYMPYWLGIYWAGGSENGIHGLPYQPGGAPVWADSLGTPVTFGCVLLGEVESATLWQMAYIGMPVEISY